MFKKSLFSMLVLAGLVLSACAPMASSVPESVANTGGERQSFGYAGGDASGVMPPMEAPAPAQDLDLAKTEFYASSVSDGFANTTGSVAPATTDRLVIRNATLSLVVKDTVATVDAVSALAESVGGFVVSSGTYQASTDAEGKAIMSANISIRVPATQLNEVLKQIEGMAVTVQNKNITGEDVTAQYTDLQSQLTNLEAAEKQLQNIMDGATKTEDVLNVYNQLTYIRGQIEQIKGQMKYYSESASMSLISIALTPDALSRPIEVGGWKPEGVAKEAIEDLISALQGIATAIIRFTVLYLPLLALLALPVLVVGFFARRWWMGRNKKPTPPPAA